MTRKIVAALALSLAFGGAALAQTGGGANTGAGGNVGTGAMGGSGSATTSTMPTGWQGPIGDAFYSNGSAGTLRSQDEIRANWGNLSAEQQAQVKSDCQNYASASGSMNQGGASMAQGTMSGANQDTAGSGASAGTAPGSATGTDLNTTASTSPEQTGSMSQLCGWVQSM